MSLLQSISDFFQSIFMSSSPDVKKRQALKKIEGTLRDIHPVIFKNELVQPNFAEALRILYVNTKPIDDLLSETICSDDLQRNNRFTEQLLLTGFTLDAQETLDSLSYENQKRAALEADSLPHFFEKEHRELEGIIKQLNTQDFVKIDSTIDRIKQLTDICRYNYITVIRLFDQNFTGTNPSYAPNFQAITPELLETPLLDLYYVTAEMSITTTLSKALFAILDLYYHGSTPSAKKSALLENLEKIQSVLKNILVPETLVNLIRYAKKEPDFTPQKAQYHGNARQKYADYLESRFTADQNRLKVEIKDEMIGSEVHDLFGEHPLEELAGYNDETNTLLRQNMSVAFNWITPMEVTKTFFMVFYSEQVKTLLNDIVIEGFFNNPAYKSEFSSAVYACNDSSDRIDKFEKAFARDGEFDEAVISSLIHDSHKDNDFGMKLKEMVEEINMQAKKIVQAEATNVYDLYMKIGEILIDSKKPTPDSISNLKVLMGSSRNRDSTTILEQQYPQWKIFLEIMKNYAIIGTIENNT